MKNNFAETNIPIVEKMSDVQWMQFFRICSFVLGRGHPFARLSESWCGWTTFDKFSDCIYYWNSGLPNTEDLMPTYVKDCGAWRQPFQYQAIAHIVIPREFGCESGSGAEYRYDTKFQNIEKLSLELSVAGIEHRKTNRLLELKFY